MYGNTVPSYSGQNPKLNTKRPIYNRSLFGLFKGRVSAVFSFAILQITKQLFEKTQFSFPSITAPFIEHFQTFAQIQTYYTQYLSFAQNTIIENFELFEKIPQIYITQLNFQTATPKSYSTLQLGSAYTVNYTHSPSLSTTAASSAFENFEKIPQLFEYSLFSFEILNSSSSFINFEIVPALINRVETLPLNLSAAVNSFSYFSEIQTNYTANISKLPINSCQIFLIQ